MTDNAPQAEQSPTPLQLTVITGSVRQGRFGPVLTAWLTERAREYGAFEVDVVDLADHPLPAVLTDTPDAATSALLAEVSPRLARADAFWVVTPEYNHSFPAPLKNLIDWHREEWRAKPVAFASYGGASGGIRAVEQLRQVFPELHAMTVRDALSFANYWDHVDEEGRPVAAESANAAAKKLLAQLEWWAEALRTARWERPYPG